MHMKDEMESALTDNPFTKMKSSKELTAPNASFLELFAPLTLGYS